MAKPTKKAVARALLDKHGKTFSEELKIRVGLNSPSSLFQLLCASILFSARISSHAAREAFRALRREGWTTAQKMADSSWERRAQVLNEAGYARYDNRTATMLGDSAKMVLEQYKGDLRNLREQANHDPLQERSRIMRFKGIGSTGADIFFREVQDVWEELSPFVDKKAQKGAERLGLPKDPKRLKRYTDGHTFSELVAGLVRVQLERDVKGVVELAAHSK